VTCSLALKGTANARHTSSGSVLIARQRQPIKATKQQCLTVCIVAGATCNSQRKMGNLIRRQIRRRAVANIFGR